ncbi:uncharacterized protein [Diadema antillarum]|uniref:uncharacterized protein n=1 Tax=Diadema antillarum TaxID=105358 RepID=UPI003A8BC116
MKGKLGILIVAALFFAVVHGNDDSYWNVEWTTEEQFNLESAEDLLFASPGVIVPNISVSNILSVIGSAWRANDVVQAMGYLCVELGPQINWMTDGIMQEVCDPILEALRNGSYEQVYDICLDTWSLLSTLIGEETEYVPLFHHTSNYWVMRTLVLGSMGLEYVSKYDMCRGFDELLSTGIDDYSSVFDRLLYMFVYEVPQSNRWECFNDWNDESYQAELLGATFTYLGNFGSNDEFCNYAQESFRKAEDENDRADLEDMVQDLKNAVYAVIANKSECLALMAHIGQELDISAVNISTYDTNQELCDVISDSFSLQPDLSQAISMVSNDTIYLSEREWFDTRVTLAGALFVEDDVVESVKLLCYAIDLYDLDKSYCAALQNSSDFFSQCNEDDTEDHTVDQSLITSPYYYGVSEIINNIAHPDGQSRWDTCYGLAGLLFGTEFDMIFDNVLYIYLADWLRSYGDYCGSDDDGSGDWEDTFFWETSDDILKAALAVLGDFGDISELCDNAMDASSQLNSGGGDDKLGEIIEQIMHGIEVTTNDYTECMNTLHRLENITGLSARNYSEATSNGALCTTITGLFDSTSESIKSDVLSMYEDNIYGDFLSNEEWFTRLLDTAGVLHHLENHEAVQFLCEISESTDDAFCRSITESNDYEDEWTFQSMCDGGYSPGDDIDWEELFAMVGDTFDFNFNDSRQTCSHLTDMIFDPTVAQTYTIPEVMSRALELFARISGKYLCDLSKFDDTTELVPPCETPGVEACFNWTVRGDGYYSDLENSDDPVGFVIGTTFSFLGGYENGDHICHHISVGLDNQTHMDDLVGRIQGSIYNILEEEAFCLSMFGVIDGMVGSEVSQYIGFNDSSEFCSTLAGIYEQDSDYSISLDPIFGLLGLEDTDTDDNEEFVTEGYEYMVTEIAGYTENYDEEVDPEAIRNATIEMLKIASMLIKSDHVGDAINKTCGIWEDSDIDFEELGVIDDICHVVKTGDELAAYIACTDELVPLLQYFDIVGYDGWSDFDWEWLLGMVENVLHVNLSSSVDTCSHLTDIFFDEEVGEAYTLNYFLEQGVEIMGRVAGRYLCDFNRFDSSTPLVAPCETPGVAECFNWTNRGQEYYYSAIHENPDPSGFIIGTVFSFFGGYNDGDHICHHLSFALDNTTYMEDMVHRISSSVWNLAEEQEFCEGFMTVLDNMIGINVSREIGFNSSAHYCEVITSIYDLEGNYTVSLDSIISLFESEEESPSSEDIRNGVVEIIKIATKLLHSDNIADAARKTCEIWDGADIDFPIVDEMCETLLSGDDSRAYSACLSDLFPLISESEDEDRAIELSDVRICHGNGRVSFDDFENVDMESYLFNSLEKLYNLTAFEEQDICRAFTGVANSGKNIPTLISDFAVEWLTIFLPLGGEICSCWDDVFNSLFSSLGEESPFGINEFNEVVLIAMDAIGYDNHDEFCNELQGLEDDELSEYAAEMVQQIFDFTEDLDKCACLARDALEFISPLVNISISEMNSYLHDYLGFESTDELCAHVVTSFSGEEVDVNSIQCPPPSDDLTTAQQPDGVTGSTPTTQKTSTAEACLLITDCNGVCGGDAERDCAGECGGNAVRDCAFVCEGTAFINECDWCVNGTTGRENNFGFDKCGYCWNEDGVDIDCNDDCNGTAFRDACQICVGGATGLMVNASADSLDCRGVCKGLWEKNECGECVMPDVNGNIFSTKDCHGDCNGFAEINECEYCTGGNTGLNATTGFSDCGVCNTTSGAYSCLGCDGVANSGQVVDACGVCNGDGSTCFTVDELSPSIIPANANYQIRLRGAGFQDASTVQCVYLDDSSEQVGDAVDISDLDEETNVFNCTANLPQGTYTVHLNTGGDSYSQSSVTLYVYGEITISEITDTDFDIDLSLTNVYVNMTSSNGAFTAYKDIVVPLAIVYTDTERLLFEGEFGGENDELLLFVGPMVQSSTQVTVYPSLNGIDYLNTPGGEGYTLTYYATSPIVQSFKFSPTGHYLTLVFDRFINEGDVESCDSIFANTTKLGADARCLAFAYSNRIYVIPSDVDSSVLMAPGDTLTFKENALKQRNEDYAHFVSGSVTAAAPDSPVTVHAHLSGTTTPSACGDVRLSSLTSVGNAGRDFVYTWNVSSDGSVSSTVSDALSAADGAYFTISASDLDASVAYNFSVIVENFLGESDTATLQVVRSAETLPDVVIIPQRVDTSQALVSEPFALTAFVNFHDACGGASQMSYEWSVDDTSIALNLQTRTRPTLFVPGRSLPGDSQVTFTVSVSAASDPSKVATQSVTVTTVYSDLVAVIDRGDEITVGVDSGEVVLDGSESYDPDNQDEDMTYVWTCTKWNGESYETCVSRATRQVFPAQEDTVSSSLAFDANNFYPDSTYQFTLDIAKVSRTASASITINTKSGNPPQAFTQLLPEKVGKDQPLTLQAIVVHTSAITIDWSTDSNSGYVDVNSFNPFSIEFVTTSPFYSLAYVTIPADTLDEGTAYTFRMTVTDADGQEASATLSTTTYSGVSLCSMALESGATSYSVLDQLVFVIEKCVTDEDAYPLTYQMFIQTTGSGSVRYVAQTDAQSEGRISLVGLQSIDGTDSNSFVVEVCTSYGSCTKFTLTLTVNALATFTAEQFDESVNNLVEPEKLKENWMVALVNLNTIAQIDQSSSRKRRAVSETSSTAAEQLSLLENAIEATVLDTSNAVTLLDQSNAVNVAELTLADMDTLLDILTTLVAVFADEELPESSSEIVLTKTAEIADELDPQYNSDMIDKIKALTDTLVQGQLSELTLGADPTETKTDTVTTRAFYVIPDSKLKTTSGNDSFDVDFGDEIANLYGANWNCGSTTCTGVQIQFTQYKDDVDHYSVSAEDQTNRAAAILEINLYNPDTLSELNVTGLSSPVSINMTATILQNDKVYDCVYWDTDTSSWSTDGVNTVYHSATESECSTSHLTAFTLMANDAPTTIGFPTTAGETTEGLDSIATDNVDDITETDSGTTSSNEQGSSTVGAGASTGGLSTTLIIVIAVVCSVVVLLVVVIAVVAVVIKGKQSAKVGVDVEEPVAPRGSSGQTKSDYHGNPGYIEGAEDSEVGCAPPIVEESLPGTPVN